MKSVQPETEAEPTFTPALGKPAFTSDYDRIISVMTREKKWRSLMLSELQPKAGNVVVDLGSGTGTFAIQVKEKEPGCRVIAVDPDPEVRAIAQEKVDDVQIEFATAMGDQPLSILGPGQADAATCSLVLHQCPMSMKTGILANAYKMLKAGGRLLISDYGEQRDLLMQLLFKQVRELDGYENTKPNKDGQIPILMREAGFEEVAERYVTKTPTGSISLYVGRKPA